MSSSQPIDRACIHKLLDAGKLNESANLVIKDWHLYVVRTIDGYLYAGITTDVARRVREHLAQGRKTAKYLLAHKPRSLAFSQVIGDRSLALKVEYHFKRLSSKAKRQIMDAGKLHFHGKSGKILTRE
jgi:putative endonuclease